MKALYLYVIGFLSHSLFEAIYIKKHIFTKMRRKIALKMKDCIKSVIWHYS